jgi:hypothetical protein
MLNRAPNIWTLKNLLRHCSDGLQVCVDKVWVPARVCGYYSLRNRLRCAWLVFTGRADVLIWPEDEKR